MATVSGQGTTFNLPNYVGELFAVSREDTPFLSAIGGLNGGRPADGILFPWQTYDLRTPEADRQALEGADAPAAEERSRSTVYNVVEIHHEAIEVSYTKQAATGQFSSTGSTHTGAVGIAGSNPVTSELDWQVTQALKTVARDINTSFINGTFANPATNATARATRGLLAAITTNEVAGAGTLDLASSGVDAIGDLMQEIYDNGGIREGETRTLLTNSTQKRKLTTAFKAAGYEIVPASRNVGGVAVDTIVTDFGTLNVMLEPAMPQASIAVVSLAECAARFLPIPGKGMLFVEDLAKTGSAERKQVYCEVGLEYGIESHHGKITALVTA